MSVYVGPTFLTPTPSPRWPYPFAAHLYADTDPELLAFAARIGLEHSWAQRLGHYTAHFDVTPSKRNAALLAGAIPHTARDEGRWLIARRTAPRP